MGFSEVLFLAGVGSILGLTEGVKPGPLLTMVIKETLTHGLKAGVRAAAAPIFTDGPLIIISFFVAGLMSENAVIFAVISLLGSIFLAKMGIDCFQAEPPSAELLTEERSGSLRRGVLTNLLNPNVYVFWLLIGGPFMSLYYKVDPLAPLAYAISFLLTIIAVKSGVAYLFHRSRGRISAKGYRLALGFCGIAMFFFSASFIYRSFTIFVA